MHCSSHERRADDASRDVEAWLKCQFMRERLGEQFAGRITGVATFGVFVTLNDLYVEGLVHVSELGTEYFKYNESAHELRGERTGKRYRLTDELHVQVSRVDLEARRVEFRLVQRVGFRGPGGTGTGGPHPRAGGAQGGCLQERAGEGGAGRTRCGATSTVRRPGHGPAARRQWRAPRQAQCPDCGQAQHPQRRQARRQAEGRR
jgi:ribonuclease R